MIHLLGGRGYAPRASLARPGECGKGGALQRGKGKAHVPSEPLDRTTVHSLILSLSSDDDGAEVCVTYSLSYPVSAAGVVERVVEPGVANGVAKCVTSSRRSKDAVSQAGLVGYHSVGDRLDVM